jgi:hypothetical protein
MAPVIGVGIWGQIPINSHAASFALASRFKPTITSQPSMPGCGEFKAVWPGHGLRVPGSTPGQALPAMTDVKGRVIPDRGLSCRTRGACPGLRSGGIHAAWTTGSGRRAWIADRVRNDRCGEQCHPAMTAARYERYSCWRPLLKGSRQIWLINLIFDFPIHRHPHP